MLCQVQMFTCMLLISNSGPKTVTATPCVDDVGVNLVSSEQVYVQYCTVVLLAGRT